VKRLGGPELKMPELKVPPFLADLYYDLLDRRLLPLVALVVVAIAAVPFLLGGDSEEESPLPVPDAVAGASALDGGEAPALAVVEAKPGLRDYRKRLKGRTPTDPFEQRYTGPVSGGGGQLPDETTTEAAPITATTETSPGSGGAPPSSGPPASSPPQSGDGGSGDEPSLRLFTFAIDVQISRSETKQNGRTVMSEPTTKRGVLPTTPLPGEKAPVVTYMGANAKNATKALLMVSNNVKSVFGDAKCLSGTDTCQLIEVEPGFPQIFVYGPNDVRYKINVIKIEAVLSGRT
jgi:hypothetical protein